MIEFTRDPGMTLSGLKSPRPSVSPASKAYDLQQSGDKLFSACRFAQAKDFYQKSLDAFRKADDIQGVAATLQRWGRAVELSGDYGQARGAYQESLQLFESLSDLLGIARGKAHLGNVAWALGEYERAGKYLDEALSLYRVSEDIPGEAWVLDLMGNLKIAMREDSEAEAFHQKAFGLVEGLGVNLENRAWNEYHLGALALFRGQSEEAQARFSDALKSFTKLKDDLGQVAVLTHLGEIACAGKKYLEAQKNLQKAVKLVLPTQCKPLLADVLTAVAQLMKEMGDDRKAVSLLMVALSHPTCRQQTKDRMVDLSMALNAHFSESEAQKGFEWAKSVSLEDVASAWASSSVSKEKKGKK